MGKFDGKVVVITGAGGGIGRMHAIGFAKEGAKVIVNDLGSARDGKGQSQNMADKVVKEILDLGGEAVANYDSVADMVGASNIVKTAVDKFGRVDVLVNNAGILRDKTFLKMDEQMWDLVIAVHLKGTFAVTKAVAPIMKEQNYGRIINTTSVSGLIGNFGQSNYSAAKAGIYGFTRTLSLELERYSVTVNCIAPTAKTRMTEDIDVVSDDLMPEQITPMVMYLASEKAKDVTGRVFGIYGQELFEYVMDRTPGVEKDSNELWTLDEIHQKLSEISAKEKIDQKTISTDIFTIIPKLNEILQPLGVQVNSLGDIPTVSSAKKDITLSDMFQKMKDVIVPAKIADWKTTVLFEIEGDEPQSVYIDGENVQIKAERATSPDCVVSSDKESMLAMLKGTADPTKLYMKGKLKATKLPIFMKYGQAFNLSALPSLIKEMEQGKTTPLSKTEDTQVATSINTISGMFEKLEEVFKPENAGSFSGGIQFLIKGDKHQFIDIQNGKLKIQEGKGTKPILTVRTDKEKILALLKGDLDVKKAVMKGQIKTDHTNLLMKFGAMFDLKSLPSKLTITSTAPSSVVDGLNRDFIGRWYASDAQHVIPEHVKSYAKATNETNSRYYSKDNNTLAIPPVFPVVFGAKTLEDVIMDADLNMNVLRMVHSEQDIRYLRPLKAWDLVYPIVEVIDIETKSGGSELMTLKVTGQVSGVPVYEMFVKLFVKGSTKGKKSTIKAEEPDHGKPIFIHKIKVDPDQTERYAEASGDHNPIHLDEDVAKSAGLPGRILHGLCTMAFTGQAIVDNLLKGNSDKLERIKVRFSKPVILSDELTTKAWLIKEENKKKFIFFEMFNQSGTKVITQGEATIKT